MTFLPPGKLPSHLLKSFLDSISLDEDVIVGPGVGRDAAAVRAGGQILVFKTDPITFPTSQIGSYVVNINANDIACMGAVPRWLLVTALLPEHTTTPELVETIFNDLKQACSEIDCSLIGGHTEITEGLNRPILVGQMIGVATDQSLINPETAHPGDAVMLAGGIAIEGTAILAAECTDQLENIVERDLLASARTFSEKPGISVLPYARRLSEIQELQVRAMHDPTEGGLATGLREIAAATGCGIEVDADSVHIYPETTAITRALGIDPWGLIASGALLFVVSEEQVSIARKALNELPGPVARIGRLTADTDQRTLTGRARTGTIPEFETDEIARFFATR